MSKLEEILQQEAEAEINSILAEADSRAREIVSQAESRAAALLAAHRQRIEAGDRAASQQARSAAELSVSSARMQAKGEVMDLLRQKVLARPGKDSFPTELRRGSPDAGRGGHAGRRSGGDRSGAPGRYRRNWVAGRWQRGSNCKPIRNFALGCGLWAGTAPKWKTLCRRGYIAPGARWPPG